VLNTPNEVRAQRGRGETEEVNLESVHPANKVSKQDTELMGFGVHKGLFVTSR